MRYPTISDRHFVQSFYEKMRDDGQDHRFAEMCALQQPPGVTGDDASFLRGRHNGDQFKNAPHLGIESRRASERMSPGCTSGAVYQSGLASFPNDPKAWVRGRGDVLRRAREKNVSVSGMVKYTAHEVAPPKSVPLSETLIGGMMSARHRQDPADTPAKAKKLREDVINDHTPHWKK